MTILKFSFVVTDDSENAVNKLKEWLQNNFDGTIVRWDLFKRDVSESPPELENRIVNVEYESKITSKERDSTRYLQLIHHFLSESLDKLTTTVHRPWLSLLDGKSFIKERCDFHSLELTELCFGTLISSSSYLCHYRVPKEDLTVCIANFFHDIRQMLIRCRISETEYELIVDYNDIKLIISTYPNSTKNGTTILYLYLCNSPLVYIYRLVGAALKKVRCLTLTSLDADILGRSRVICLKINSANDKERHSVLSRLHARCNNIPINYANISVSDKMPCSTPNVDLEHFGITYMLQGIFKKSYFVLEQLNDNIDVYISKLKELAENDSCSLEKTLVDLSQAIDDGKIFDVWTTTLRLYTWHASNERNSFNHFVVPPKTKMVRRLIITPTRWLYWPADIISENRILRNFSADHTIRITFRDDNYNRLPSTDCEYTVYQEAVKRPLTEGIVIGTRKYGFLAWSNSQLREHSVWMYAEDPQNNTAFSIRSWMGKFSSIKLVGKFMARMGQCFSQTEDTMFVPLEENSVQTEDDKMDGFDAMTGKQYCFSDGVGKISECLAKKVCEILDLKKTYSAFQIRYSGYKGMLTVDPLLKDINIVFRKSMLKFECPESTRLEIVKISNSGSLQLNRPFITILDQMGVPHTLFLKLQTEMLINIIEMFLDENKAAEYLSLRCSTPYLKFRDLSDVGFSLTTEPFFHAMLLAIHKRMTWGIKAKAQIDIDPSEGRNMFGVMDESKELNYGQVFIQYTTDIRCKNMDSPTTILTGKVLVTKNPCLQPGDVRMLEAVDIPDLHHIVDCIVFPQFGKRPHPNEMGGSDLDGDEYTVIWKKELFIQNSTPRHFPSCEHEQEGLRLRRPVTVTDMIAFFVDFIKNDQLGLIGTAHLIQADLRGLHHPICDSIAEKYSVAVDFPKTGLKRRLADNEKPCEYPDFMQKKDKRTYKSTRALGKMFRACQFMVRQGDMTNYMYENIEVDQDLVYPGWEKYYNGAEQSKYKYIQHIKYLMHHYGVQHEAELISGCFTRFHGRHREYQQYRREVEEILSKSIRALWKSMRREFMEEFTETNSDDDMLDISNIHSELLRKASAWYMVTYNNKNAKYLSFPWIVTKYLVVIKLKNMKGSVSLKPYGYSLSRLSSNLLDEKIIQQLPSLDATTIDKLCKTTLEISQVVLYTALQLIIKWSYKVKVVFEPNESYFPLNKMNLSSLVDIFIEAMHDGGFICKPYKAPIKMKSNQEIGPLLLCSHFFRFCVLLRNIPKDEMKKCYPFIPASYKNLAKLSGPAYQCLVVSNSIKIFGFSIQANQQLDDEEMEPISIDKAVFDKSVLQNSPEGFAVYNLQCWSGVKDIQMRKSNNRFIVTASGPTPNILVLQQILSKHTQWLKTAFCTGRMPEKDQIEIEQSFH